MQELAYVVGKERAEQLADAFAHQLAEQLRRQCDCGDEGTCRCMCADRIDPKERL
ncbi:hypothetical protein [Streptomyces sp. NPDC059224]|uniref:hypothetical protein n=1 Tax=Streptomyces sp. NPDC059224 TaxID=3346775 RepID=UPI0036A06B9F